jgi:thioredoxin-related protein
VIITPRPTPEPDQKPGLHRQENIMFRLVPIITALLLQQGNGYAQGELRFIEDYKLARGESLELRKPLFILISSPDCQWCQKLKKETFADPAIRERFGKNWIIADIDAIANRNVTESLKIRSVPTLVFASPEGKVILSVEGFQNSLALGAQLDRARFQWENESESLLTTFREAISKLKQKDLVGAEALLNRVLENPTDSPLRQEAAYLADQIHRNTDPGAILNIPDQTFQDILAKHKITGSEASGFLMSRSTERPTSVGNLSEFLKSAKEDLSRKQIAIALDKLEWVSQQSQSIEGIEAKKLLNDLHSSPESLRFAAEQLQDKWSQTLLQLAETNLAAGEPQQAIAAFSQIVRINPNSRTAEIAQARLAQLQGQPTKQPNK